MEVQRFTQLKSNLFFAILAQGISFLLSCMISIFLPNVLGVEQFSYWQLFVFYSTYVGLFHFGVSDGIYLKFGGQPYDSLNKRLLGSQLRLMVLLEFVASAVIVILTFIFVQDTNRKFAIIAVTFYMIATNITWFFGYVFQAANETKRYSVSVIISKLSFIGFVFILIALSNNRFEFFVAMFIVAQMLAAIYSIYFAKDIAFAVKVGLKPTVSAFVDNAKIGAILMLSNVAGNLILGSGKFVVDRVWGLHAFGMFAFAISLSHFFLQFIVQVSLVLFPALRQSNTKDKASAYHMLNRILDIVLPVILVGYAPLKIVLSIWLPQYQESLRYLALLLPICIFDGKMILICNTYFKVFRKEKVLLCANLSSVFLSLVLSVLAAYVMNSIVWIIVLLVAVIAFRSMISQLYLARLMNTAVWGVLLQQSIMATIFMLASWSWNDRHSFILFLVVYCIYLCLYKRIGTHKG